MSTRDCDPGAGAPLIAVRELAKRFGARTAVSRLSLDLRAGEIFGLIGANGGGKTTALRMLAGLLAPDTGAGTVLGLDLARQATRIRQGIGYMSQSLALYPTLSVYENLRFRAEIHGVDRPRAAAQKIMGAFGLAWLRGTWAGKLSGGWARLLQLAASLIHEPRLVLLDEPTAGLDTANRRAVWRHILALGNAGVGVVVSTHDLADAERCTHMALLSAGQMRATGTARQIIEQASATALMASGGQLSSLATVLERKPAVIDVAWSGHELRIVVESSSAAGVERIAHEHQCRAVQAPLDFADATLALSRSVHPMTGTE
jgi:ABC-2 type transport system ATP-binding protein